MRNISRNRFRAASLMLGAVLAFGNVPARALFGIGDVVTDPTLTMKTMAAEAARLGQTAQMIQNQINQFNNMVQNTLSLGDPIFKPLGDTLRSLYSVYSQGQMLMGRAQNMDQMFMYMNPGYQSYLYTMGQGNATFGKQYQDWSNRNDQGVRDALKASGIVIDSGESTHDALKRISLQSATAGGQKQAIQAGNSIAAMQVQELGKLQRLMYDQTTMWGNYLSVKNQQEAMSNAALETFRRDKVIITPSRGF